MSSPSSGMSRPSSLSFFGGIGLPNSSYSSLVWESFYWCLVRRAVAFFWTAFLVWVALSTTLACLACKFSIWTPFYRITIVSESNLDWWKNATSIVFLKTFNLRIGGSGPCQRSWKPIESKLVNKLFELVRNAYLSGGSEDSNSENAFHYVYYYISD